MRYSAKERGRSNKVQTLLFHWLTWGQNVRARQRTGVINITNYRDLPLFRYQVHVKNAGSDTSGKPFLDCTQILEDQGKNVNKGFYVCSHEETGAVSKREKCRRKTSGNLSDPERSDAELSISIRSRVGRQKGRKNRQQGG